MTAILYTLSFFYGDFLQVHLWTKLSSSHLSWLVFYWTADHFRGSVTFKLGLHITLKMTLHLLLKVMEALGSGQTSFFFWHPFCRGLLKTNQKGMNRFFNNCKVATLTVLTLYIFFFWFGVPVQVLGEQTAQQRKEEWSTEEIWLIKLFQTLVLWCPLVD